MGLSVSRAAVGVFAVVAPFFLAGCVVATTPGPAYPSQGLEWNVNRPGGDYRDFDLVTPSPETCQSACMNEPQCAAFTYVNPGIQGPNARCWLKAAASPPVPDGCCVSGTRFAGAPPATAAPPPPPPPAPAAPPPPAPPASGWQGTPPPAPPASSWQGTPPPAPAPVASRQWEPNTDRPGATYRVFDMREPRPEVCRDACWRESQCRAFTYVRPGVQGPTARCNLKNAVTPLRPTDCCLSGVR